MENILKHLQSMVTIVGLIITGVFWVHTMNGIPKRVDKLEIEVTALKTQLSKNDVKTDIIMDDVKQVKMFMLKEHIR